MQKPLAGIIFEVEGTLVDCVPRILDSWREILEAAGYSVALAQLQRYSGMDGADMLDRLLPSAPDFEKKRLLEVQGTHYRRIYPAQTTAFPGVRDLFITLKRCSFALGIATSCKKDELVHL